MTEGYRAIEQSMHIANTSPTGNDIAVLCLADRDQNAVATF